MVNYPIKPPSMNDLMAEQQRKLMYDYLHTTMVSPSFPAKMTVTQREERNHYRQMIVMRLNNTVEMEGKSVPFTELMPVRLTDRFVVFVVLDDQAVILEDEPGLFPSDALITKLRLMLG